MNSVIRKSLLVFSFLIILGAAFFGYHLLSVRAEQNGSSPNSGSTSRIQTLFNSLISLGYGSTASGSWGDWGSSWNRIYSAASKPFNDAVAKGLSNGVGSTVVAGCTTGLSCFPKSVGGVDDYNNNSAIPADSYVSSWTTCNSGNNYCNTGRSVAEKRDDNTGLVWSPRISSSLNWFQANNCDNSQAASCTANGQAACICTKLASSKTGCEGYDDGNWRLPYQKELMQSYIDGSWSKLSSPGLNYWSSTTVSYYTYQAWNTNQGNGYTTTNNKTNSNSVRCVR